MVSGRPGAEGAPREMEEDEDVNFEVWVFVVLVGWEAGGAMRRDWPDCEMCQFWDHRSVSCLLSS